VNTEGTELPTVHQRRKRWYGERKGGCELPNCVTRGSLFIDLCKKSIASIVRRITHLNHLSKYKILSADLLHMLLILANIIDSKFTAFRPPYNL